MQRILTLTLILSAIFSAILPSHCLAQSPKRLIIINSYNDGEPWADEITIPIVAHLAANDDVSCGMVNITNAMMPDTTSYYRAVNNIFADNSKTPPDYVVLIGNFAFNMRQMIKEQWGDIPMLLIAKIKETAPLDDFFNRKAVSVNINSKNMLNNYRPEYNFSAIILPDFYEQTVDLMVDMVPEMNRLVFCSDSIFVNRLVAYQINDYLKRQYPNISFRWLKANMSNADTLRHLFVDRNKELGLIMSSWFYEINDANGLTVLTTNDIKLMSMSKNPVFAMREPYIKYGAVGGVFPNNVKVKEVIIERINDMLAGKEMRNVPFYIANSPITTVNYRLLSKYGISEDSCPPNTTFYNYPQSFFDKYLWQTIAFVVFFLGLIAILWLKNENQRKRIRALNRNVAFINKMPIPYSAVKVYLDNNGKLLELEYFIKNNAFERLIELNSSPDTPFILFPSEFIVPKVEELLSSGKPIFFSYHFDKTDTHYDMILCLVNDIKNTKDNAKLVDFFAIDITKRHRIAKDLNYIAHKLDITLDAANIMPFQYDGDTGLVAYDPYLIDKNRHTCKRPNQNDKVVPFDVLLEEVVHPDDRHLHLELIEKVKCHESYKFHIEYRLKNPKTGEYSEWGEIIGSTLAIDPDKPINSLVGIFQLITERKQKEEEMAKAIEKANESDRLKSAFLANMSHEIRTPLNAIVGFSNVIAQTEDPKERMEFCDIINRNNEQLLLLINDVLDLAKIEANIIEMNPEPTDINELLVSVKKTMAPKVPAAVTLNLVLGRANCVIQIDPLRLSQVLTNLISNSCKFTEKGSINFGYEVKDEDSDSPKLCFFVQDSGKGIIPDELKKIFDRFFKSDSFTPGTGLGLSICKSIVEKMGGDMEAFSAGLGKGCIMKFWVPFDSLGDENVVDNLNNANNIREDYTAPSDDNSDKPAVLVAEDNDSNFRLIEHILSSTCRILRASDGKEAIRKFIKEKPAAVIMDLNMPILDGYQAASEIRKLSRDAVIIAVTANVLASNRVKILNSGFDGYLSKPISSAKLKETLEKFGVISQKSN